MAEETGLIVQIGNWMLKQVCIQLKNWNDHPQSKNLRIAVNVSALQFAQSDFVTEVEKIIKLSECNPKNLMLEFTESFGHQKRQ